MSQSIYSNSRVKSSEPTASIERNGTMEKATSSSRTPKRASQKSLQGSVALSWGLAQVHRTVKGFPTHIQHQQSTCWVKSYCTCNLATMRGGVRSALLPPPEKNVEAQSKKFEASVRRGEGAAARRGSVRDERRRLKNTEASQRKRA